MVTTSNKAENASDDASFMPWINEAVQSALATQRGHALLIHGPLGIGQFEMALALATAWLCESPTRSPTQLACGHCGSCRLIANRSHPDLRVIVPEAYREAAGMPADDSAANGDDSKKRKPSREIKVEQMRSALGFSELTAGRGALKVLLIHPAEALNPVSANALLKTLEEPSGAMRFILSSAAPHLLMPTIRSRCQAVRMTVPPPQLALNWLIGKGVNANDAPILLRIAGGQPLLAWSHAQATRGSALWQAFPHLIERQDVTALGAWPLAVLVDALERLCHDVMSQAVGAPTRYFDVPPAGQRNLHALSGLAKDLRELHRQAEHPWNLPLSLEALILKASRAFEPLSQRPSRLP